MKLVILYLCSFIFGSLSLAASCCTGGYSGAALIVGSHDFQISHVLNYSHSLIEVDSASVWRKNTTTDFTARYKLDIAHRIYDDYQIGLSLPIEYKRSDISTEKADTGLADFSFFGAYELLPFRLFATLTAPTAYSLYDVDFNAISKTHGQGFYTFSLGTLYKGGSKSWDYLLNMEVHQSLNRSFISGTQQLIAKPGWGGSVMVQLSYTLQKWIPLISIKNNYDSPIKITGSINSDGTLKRSTDTTLGIGYTLNGYESLNLNYTNGSWLGSPLNTSLNETISIAYLTKY